MTNKKKTTKESRVNLTRSETWLGDVFEVIQSILDETINEFIDADEQIINIEVKEHCGLKRFWIYSVNNKFPSSKVPKKRSSTKQ